MANRFSNLVTEKMTQAGWYEGRNVEVFEVAERLEALGFTVFPAAQTFLEEFDGLEFPGPEFSEGYFGGALTLVRNFIQPGDIEYVNRLVERPLCPVGYYSDAYVFIADDASVVLLNNDWTCYWQMDDVSTFFEHWFVLDRNLLDPIELTHDRVPSRYIDRFLLFNRQGCLLTGFFVGVELDASPWFFLAGYLSFAAGDVAWVRCDFVTGLIVYIGGGFAAVLIRRLYAQLRLPIRARRAANAAFSAFRMRYPNDVVESGAIRAVEKDRIIVSVRYGVGKPTPRRYFAVSLPFMLKATELDQSEWWPRGLK